MTVPLIGHETQERAVLDAIGSGRMPHCWLLTGPQGVGKAAFARRAGGFLVGQGLRSRGSACDSLALPADHPAMRLIDAGAHPDFLVLRRDVAKAKRDKNDSTTAPREEDLARNITVDQLRELLIRLRVRPADGGTRAVIIDSVDDFERGAANALLKTIEEPPQDTVFLLVSHMPGRLLPTIRSRARVLRFAPLDDEAMARALRAHLPTIDPAELGALVASGRGSPGRALGATQLSMGDLDRSLNAIADHGDRDNRVRSALAQKLAPAAEKPRFEAMIRRAQSLAADRAMEGEGSRRVAALAAHQRITSIARHAVSGSEDATMVTYAVAGALATIAAAG